MVYKHVGVCRSRGSPELHPSKRVPQLCGSAELVWKDATLGYAGRDVVKELVEQVGQRCYAGGEGNGGEGEMGGVALEGGRGM